MYHEGLEEEERENEEEGGVEPLGQTVYLVIIFLNENNF